MVSHAFCNSIRGKTMMSYRSIRATAISVASHSTDPEVKRLAQALQELCKLTEDAEKTAKSALSKANQAKR
jgi:hypothetical protein